ncbi:DUF2715 domain-containing protein [Treponema sp. OMZ 787]|uniref:DUF2715 domain-containing protein n=1 Tax=Treponema sp. OMZ 787 TaxID=2563669 RepID=UPI0020A60940|nr:DUF2715 domain-containing protein [Treponema sp. OMZ 787]UTC62009.1 DUF2715 domain-containing protein [Treponema sp. OMZ 787]
MNKKIFFVFVGLVMISTASLSARDLGIDLDVGGAYTRHSQHYIGSCCDGAGFSTNSKASKNLGGIHLGVNFGLPKNWSVFADTMFTFNKTLVNDTQLGIGYNFLLGKGFKLFVGGAFSFGGSISKYSDKHTTRYFGIGGGLNVTASYMFTRKFGIYFGVADNYYKPVSGKNKEGNITTEFKDNDFKNKIHQSINAKVGIRVKL